METSDRQPSGLMIFSRVLYALALVGVVVSVLLGLSVANAASVIPAATIGFQSPAIKPLWDALVSGLLFLGVLVLISGGCMSLLLAAAGVLVGRTGTLNRRVQRLESVLGDTNALGPATGLATPAKATIWTDIPAEALGSHLPI
ncbi:MAG: hypothetical protein IPK16_19530 [Anaerolineales bacterium]|nr:hypothetical protein [Anaerolineales bacterium]